MYRRQLLAVLGVGALAGCGSIDALRSGQEHEESLDDPTTWFIDPEPVADAPNLLVGSADVEVVVEHREELPPIVDVHLDRLENEIASLELGDLERVAGTGYLGPEFDRMGGVAAADGSFDPDALEADIESLGLEPVDGSDEDYDWYTGEEGGFDAAAAVSSDQSMAAVVDGETDPVVLIETALETGADDDAAATDRESVDTALDTVETADVSAATVAPFQQVARGRVFPVEPLLAAVLDGLASLGVGIDLEGAEAHIRHGLVYEAADAVDEDAIETFTAMIEEDDRTTFRDVETEIDSGVVTIEMTGDTSELITDYVSTAVRWG